MLFAMTESLQHPCDFRVNCIHPGRARFACPMEMISVLCAIVETKPIGTPIAGIC